MLAESMETPTSYPYLFAIPIVVVLYTLWTTYDSRFYRKSRLSFPPGPKGLPIFGSFFDVLMSAGSGSGSEAQWATYLEMEKKYDSDILHINVFGDHTVILNSAKDAEELLDKRSGIYSSRPPMYMARALSGWGWHFATMQYSPWWRLHRRTFHQHFRPDAVAAYQPYICQATSDFLRKLACRESPESEIRYEDLQTIVHEHAGAVILRVTYGITKKEDMDYYTHLVNNAAESMIETMRHGNFLVDYFPFLKYVPAWFPGAFFKRRAERWARFSSDLVNKPWENLRASVASGTALSCFATECLQKLDLISLDNLKNPGTDMNENMEEVVRNCAGIAYIAGSDTSVSLVMICIFVLSYHPEVQAKAKEELDRVVGCSQLPSLNDRENLPYVDAIFKELLRMYPGVPLGVPHCSIAHDVYRGYFIPKGTTVVGNAWAILHDENIYPDPLVFNPDRFLKMKGDRKQSLNPDPELYAFGFGRRICPGRYLALDSSWLALACLLATCNITRISSDSNKSPEGIDPIADFVDGVVAHPKPFRCCISPRSPAASELMKSGYEADMQEGE